MIVNPEIVENKMGVSERVAKYLIEKCHLPLLGMTTFVNTNITIYYFTDSEDLRVCMKNMPFWMKLFK